MLAAAVLCIIVGITDGDTLTARCPATDAAQPAPQIKIRLAGIDAPERGQPFGNRAKRALSDLCFQQRAAVRMHGLDRYGRTIADVQCRDKDAGTELVTAGMAWVYDRYSKGHESLYPLQSDARTARRGLWSDPGAVAPWVWRHRAVKPAPDPSAGRRDLDKNPGDWPAPHPA